MIDLADTRFDLLVVEQLHDVVQCEDDSGCDRAAHWVLACAGCAVVDFLCTPHRVEFEEWAATLEWVACKTCKTHLPDPLPWQAI